MRYLHPNVTFVTNHCFSAFYLCSNKLKLFIMKKNMGNIDRALRILIAAVIIGLYFMGQISGTIAIIGLVFSAIFILTSFISFCPLYLPFNFSTRKEDKE